MPNPDRPIPINIKKPNESAKFPDNEKTHRKASPIMVPIMNIFPYKLVCICNDAIIRAPISEPIPSADINTPINEGPTASTFLATAGINCTYGNNSIFITTVINNTLAIAGVFIEYLIP